MAQRKETPSLVAAATALDDELRVFDELAREAKEQRLNGQKALSRTAGLLNDSLGARTRIEEGVRRLVSEIGRAQGRQQASIEILVEVAAQLELRTKQRGELLGRFAGLGASASRVNALAADLALRRQGGAAEAEILALLQEIQGQMTGVANEADELTEAAEKDGWPDIARQADAVRQQVNAVKSKLAAAHRNIAANAPS
jgi:hypothetical protein